MLNGVCVTDTLVFRTRLSDAGIVTRSYVTYIITSRLSMRHWSKGRSLGPSA